MQPHPDQQVARRDLRKHILRVRDATHHRSTPAVIAQAVDHELRRHLIRREVEGQEPQLHIRAGCEQGLQRPRESFQLGAVLVPEADGHADRPHRTSRRVITRRVHPTLPEGQAHHRVRHDCDALPREAHPPQQVRGLRVADRH
ncbi:hypothetical protein D3C85_958330 [compost metagenome]